jgi:hypothetical protein
MNENVPARMGQKFSRVLIWRLGAGPNASNHFEYHSLNGGSEISSANSFLPCRSDPQFYFSNQGASIRQLCKHGSAQSLNIDLSEQ